jgi:hypothetical protein
MPGSLSHADASTYYADTARIRQTCKEFHELLSDRSIWEIAVQQMCRENYLFEPSFPTELMNLYDLQRAALGPTLWNNKMLRAGRDGKAVEPLEDHLKIRPFEHGEYYRVTSIVPGGRYLLAAAMWRFDLWDLGVAGQHLRGKSVPAIVGTKATGRLKIEHVDLAPHNGRGSLQFLTVLLDDFTMDRT